MEFHYLRIFHAIAREEGFTKAADALNISQPALSIQIKKLEEGLGVKLFDRMGNKAVLNENGRLLYEATCKVFTILEEAEHELIKKKDFISGPVYVGGSATPGTYLLPRIIREFKRQYPLTSTKLHIANIDETASLVADGRLDFAVNGGEQEYNDNVYAEKLMDERILFVVEPSSPLAGIGISDPEDLKDVDFIAHESNPPLNRFIEDVIKEMNLPSKIVMSLGSIDALKQATAAGLGITTITYSSVALELKLGLLAEVKFKNKEMIYPYYLIYNKNKYLTPTTKKLIEMVRISLKK